VLHYHCYSGKLQGGVKFVAECYIPVLMFWGQLGGWFLFVAHSYHCYSGMWLSAITVIVACSILLSLLEQNATYLINCAVHRYNKINFYVVLRNNRNAADAILTGHATTNCLIMLKIHFGCLKSDDLLKFLKISSRTMGYH
jgi:hypothetical protein